MTASADRGDRERLSFVGLFVDTIGALPSLLVPILAGLYGTRGTGIGALPVVAVILGFSLALRWLAWMRFHYQLGSDDIRIESGLFRRTARSIPYDRIADVSIEQPPLARLLSLAVVQFETGGGKGEEGVLRFVALADAERLRSVVRSRRDSSDLAASPAEAAADEQAPDLLFAMGPKRILTLGFYSFSLVAFAVLLGLAGKFDFLLPDLKLWVLTAEQQSAEVGTLSLARQIEAALAALAALTVLGIGTGLIRTALREWGFRLERTPKGLRRRRGMLTLTDVTIPLERVQAAEIATGPIRKRRGWHALALVTFGDKGDSKASQAVAPLARIEEIQPIMALTGIEPADAETRFARAHFGARLDWAVLRSLLFAGLGLGLAQVEQAYGWLMVLPITLMALRDWLRWNREWRATDRDQLFMQSGWWRQALLIARQVNVHSVSIARSPLERRRGLATVHFGLANCRMRFPAVPVAEALAIREQVLAQAAPVDFSQLGRSR